MATSDDDIPVLTDIVEGAVTLPLVSPPDDRAGEPPVLSIFAEPAPAAAPPEARFDWGAPVEDTPPYALGEADRRIDPVPHGDDPVAEPSSIPTAMAFVAPAGPAANDAPHAVAPPDESRDALETRLFEALAARMDRLLDERLEALVPGIVEASLAGVKAGLSASVRQALRESIEAAIRDEFERRP